MIDIKVLYVTLFSFLCNFFCFSSILPKNNLPDSLNNIDDFNNYAQHYVYDSIKQSFLRYGAEINLSKIPVVRFTYKYYETHLKELFGFDEQKFVIVDGENKKNITPKYEKLNDDAILQIKSLAFASITQCTNHVARNLVTIIDENGHFIEEYTVSRSIFHAVTNNELGDYIYIKFTRPLSPREMPQFINFRNEIYRTDVFAGSRIKEKPNEDNFGGLFGISLQAGDFFAHVLTNEESFWYTQRAFAPEGFNEVLKSI